ncbi:MAG: efflux RND transporter periplasmic adaptor subunit [Cellvibrionaceae bacterium]
MQASLNQIWINKNYRYATIIALLMLIWLGSGFVSGEKAETNKPQVNQKETLTQVRAKHARAMKFPLRVLVKGKTESDRFVDVKAEVTGQVEDIVVEKGKKVARGDAICRLAVEDRALRLEEAKSNAEQTQIEYDGSLRLKTGGYQSKTAIASAKSRLDTAKATLLRRKIDLEKTVIRAPFDGVLDQRPAEIGALMRAGDICATVLDLDPLVISGQVSEADVVKIPKGSSADVRLATGEILKGSIRYISRSADEMTRTYRIEVAVDNPDMRLFSGVTAEIGIYIGDTKAHLISASLLMLADDGQLGIRVLDDDHKVVFYDVNIVGDAEDGVWVTGLPETIKLITVGQEYVGEGEKVDVTFVDNIPGKISHELVKKDVVDQSEFLLSDMSDEKNIPVLEGDVAAENNVISSDMTERGVIDELSSIAVENDTSLEDSAEKLDELKRELKESETANQLKTIQDTLQQVKDSQVGSE